MAINIILFTEYNFWCVGFELLIILTILGLFFSQNFIVINNFDNFLSIIMNQTFHNILSVCSFIAILDEWKS
jgi:hypothetical protein